MECYTQKPFKVNPTFEYSFAKSGNTVIVTQDFNLESGFVDSFLMWLFRAKNDMAK